MRKKTIDTIPVLSDDMIAILASFSNSRSLPSSLTKRSTVVIMASRGCTNQDIAKKIDLHYNSVALWRTRFMDALPFLCELEATDPDKLSEAIRHIFSDKQRSGCPAVYTPEQIVKIIDLACKAPSDFGYEVSQWSLNLLVAEIKKQGIAEQISAKSVSRFLKMKSI
ncbi:helix-turn-helix domain-containing protein [Acetobacterium sp.]|jgi:transposase|uniref:helix-turn-helix domain-containing protein n=1 Tax=Acetobacterium sp. TaxID=1872094 RepID=UPI00271BA23A|nr:helix-turn-helix domain-containing protein [Acetobacterium sp.]MDO9491145.1 helix-turn-helix domain-containing protein [Acetobacterium sp.]